MSDRLKVGDVVQFNYNEYSWNQMWKGITMEIIDVNENYGSYGIKIIKKDPTSGSSLGIGHVFSTFVLNPKCYLVLNKRKGKTHLPKWW